MSKRFATSAPGTSGNKTVGGVERAFKASTHIYPEAGTSVAERYGKLLVVFPWLSKRSLYERFDDEFQKAFDSRDLKQVLAASELASLRMRLYEVLGVNTCAMGHSIEYEIEATSVWFAKLVDQIAVCNASGRKRKVNACHLWMM